MPQPATPAERVERLRRKYGSHDKLAAAIREKARELGVSLRSESAPSRQMVIRWEQAASGISEPYALILAALEGSDPEAFRPPAPSPQFRAARREVVRLRDEVAALRDDVDAIWEALGGRGIARPESS